MKLLNGTEVDVLGEIPIDGIKYLITKLPNSVYNNGTVIRYVLMRSHDFQEHHEIVKRESAELTNFSKDDNNDIVVAGEVSKTDQSST